MSASSARQGLWGDPSQITARNGWSPTAVCDEFSKGLVDDDFRCVACELFEFAHAAEDRIDVEIVGRPIAIIEAENAGIVSVRMPRSGTPGPRIRSRCHLPK